MVTQPAANGARTSARRWPQARGLVTGGPDMPAGWTAGFFVAPRCFRRDQRYDDRPGGGLRPGPGDHHLLTTTTMRCVSLTTPGSGFPGRSGPATRTVPCGPRAADRTGQIDVNGGAFNPNAPFGGDNARPDTVTKLGARPRRSSSTSSRSSAEARAGEAEAGPPSGCASQSQSVPSTRGRSSPVPGPSSPGPRRGCCQAWRCRPGCGSPCSRGRTVLPLEVARHRGHLPRRPAGLDGPPDVDMGMPDHQRVLTARVRVPDGLGDTGLLGPRYQVVGQGTPSRRPGPGNWPPHRREIVDAPRYSTTTTPRPGVIAPDLLDQFRVVAAST